MKVVLWIWVDGDSTYAMKRTGGKIKKLEEESILDIKSDRFTSAPVVK